MTKRITRQGDSIIAGEMTEYEELCEMLAGVTEKAIKDEHAERVAEPDWFDKGFSKGYRDGIVHLASCLKEAGHPDAAAAIREGIERAGEIASEVSIGDVEIDPSEVTLHGLTEWSFERLEDGEFRFVAKGVDGERYEKTGIKLISTNVYNGYIHNHPPEMTCNDGCQLISPLSEYLSAIKKRIGWDRGLCERTHKVYARNAECENSTPPDFKRMMAPSPEMFEFIESLVVAANWSRSRPILPLIQALLDQEDESDQTEETE